jgi:histidinol phosphatase-like PHP family hydrolase
LDGFRILTGIEVDIRANGNLDLPDEVLAKLDIVLASVHSAMNQAKIKWTARIIAAIENPHVDILAIHQPVLGETRCCGGGYGSRF